MKVVIVTEEIKVVYKDSQDRGEYAVVEVIQSLGSLVRLIMEAKDSRKK